MSNNGILPERVEPDACAWLRDKVECTAFRRTTSGRWVADVAYAIEVRLADNRVVRFVGQTVIAGKQDGRKPRKVETRPRRLQASKGDHS